MNDKPNDKPKKRKPQAMKPARDASANQSALAGEIQQVMNIIKPLTDFHQAVEDACENDMRLYWDVRLVRGKDTPFKHIHGTSSLPSMFASKRLPHAPSLIQSEVEEKIMMPLTEALMVEVEKITFASLAERKTTNGFVSGEGLSLEPEEEPQEDDDF